jgi:hypothetical protein
MRFLIGILLALTSCAALGSVTDFKPQPSQTYESQLDKANLEFLRQLSKKVEDAGFKHVRVIPEMFVVIVERPDGKPAAMVVDSNTLKAFEVEGGLNAILSGMRNTETSPGP